MTGQNAVVALSPKNEQFLWVVCALSAGVAFLTSHTFYVTKRTYASGAVLLGITAFLVYMRFRGRQTARTHLEYRTRGSEVGSGPIPSGRGNLVRIDSVGETSP
jgi:hypothetical protein